MNIKLVMADIDGTFLDSAGQPSEGALAAIQAIRSCGIKFTLCSGRGNPGMRSFVDLLKLEIPYIVSGGAAIIEPLDQSVIYQKKMSERQIRQAIHLGLLSGCEIIFHDAWNQYVLSSDEFWEDNCYGKWIKANGWQKLHRVQSWQEAPIQQIIRMDFFSQDERLPLLAEEVKNLGVDLHAFVMPRNIEISDRQVDKGKALIQLVEHLQLQLGNVMTIGDNVNDISMLEAAGIGVAMRNSSPDVLRRVNYLAPGCDEGGLAYTLNHLLAGKLSELRVPFTQ